MDATIEAERLHFRIPHRDIFAGIIRDGIKAGEVPDQDADLVATAIVGGIAETLVGPLSSPPDSARESALVQSVTRFCLRALGPAPNGGESPAGFREKRNE